MRAEPPLPTYRRALWFALGAAVLARLPQLFGPHLLPDGDEAIVFLMAKHLLEGRGLSLFFYGQGYGVALPEALGTAALFATLGASTMAMRLAMLAMWLVGLVFFGAAVRRLSGDRAAAIAVVLLALCPAWGAWAMKARGGYVSGFLFCNVALWRLAVESRERPPRRGPAALAGFLCGAVVLLQPLWLNALLPFVLWYAWARRASADVWWFGAVATVTVTVVALLGASHTAAAWNPGLFKVPDLWTAVAGAPALVLEAMSGAFYLQTAAHDLFPVLGATLWIVVMVLALVRVVRRPGRRALGNAGPVSWLAALAMVLVVVVAAPTATQRYLLPLASLGALLVATEAVRWIDEGLPRARVVAVVSLLTVCGTAAIASQSKLAFSGSIRPQVASEREAAEQLIARLEESGVHHVYCHDNLLQWVVIALSQERIEARWHIQADRYPDYVRSVDAALRSGERVALVGYLFQGRSIERAADGERPARSEPVGGRYVILWDPRADELERLEFELGR